jgi:lipopolysaccharide export system permease protein
MKSTTDRRSYFFTQRIVNRYLMATFLKIFLLSLLVAMFLFLVVEFVDRIDKFLSSGVSLQIILTYLLFRIPLSISRVFGWATLFSTFFALGMLSRNQEITALRCAGLSINQIAFPLLLLSLLISLFTLFWNEGLVPVFTSKSEQIYKREVKKIQPQSVIGTKDVWIRGKAGFINVDRFDAKKNVLEGLTIYVLDRDFVLQRIVEAKTAHWNGNIWQADTIWQWNFAAHGKTMQRVAATSLPLTQTPEDFKVFERDPEEFSFFDLQKQIAEFKAIGIDTTEHQVNLYVKLALPLISPLMVFIGIPFALRHASGAGMALSFGLSMAIGFGYWFLLAFGISLGRGGVIPPFLSAWLANVIFALGGLFFFTGEE